MPPLESFLEIGGVRTRVACWGRWVEERRPQQQRDELVVFVTGNPGLVGFYYPYLERLHELSGLPVWTLGHAGHEEPSASSGLAPVGPLTGREDTFNLAGQLAHKASFLREFTTPATRIHLVGHSIGAWIAMELLKDAELGPRIVSNQLLFPTLQKLGATLNAFLVKHLVANVLGLIWLLLWIYNRLPRALRTLLVRAFLFVVGYDYRSDSFVRTTKRYLRRSVIEKVVFLALDEFELVDELDGENLARNIDRVQIVFGDSDGWAPARLFDEMRRRWPELRARGVPYPHAFSMSVSKEMAALTASMLREGN